MELKQSTLEEIIESERQLVVDAERAIPGNIIGMRARALSFCHVQ